MIAKMNFISITGPKYDIDRVIGTYISKHEIHLENALVELNSMKDLKPFIESNPYKDSMNLAAQLMELAGKEASDQEPDMNADYAISYVNKVNEKISSLKTQIQELSARRETLLSSSKKIAPFVGLNYDVSDILHFHFIRYRFGRIPKEYWSKFQDYVYEDLSTIFTECAVDDEYVWGVYFVPVAENDKVDAIYSSLHFERTWIPDEYNGTPDEACKHLQMQMNDISLQIDDLENRISNTLKYEADKLCAAYHRLSDAYANFDYRKMAACTKDDNRVFYILCGWMTKEDADALIRETKDDKDVVVILEDEHASQTSTPPTKLKNPGLFKPFEMYIRMYGLPAYDEFDPTIFVALTYAFIFGAMFGDAGQGLCLLIGGFLLYRFKKIALAGIIACAGFFSTIFGFLFGSIFGFEDIIEPLWLRPIDAMTPLPFIGKLNTVFVIAVAFGMGIILFTMILNIINRIKNHQLGEALFDTNGVAGLAFYSALVAVIILFMTGNTVPGTAVLIVMFVIPLLIIAAKEPLSRLIEKKPDLFPDGKGMFVVQAVFELIEVLLSYFSNTLSFVRIGAFAVSHAAMMEVVLMLAGAENGSTGNLIVVILGNLFVMGMEGLIVGIQVLRLEYYEMFSRFYNGNGREFVPFAKNNKSSLKNK